MDDARHHRLARQAPVLRLRQEHRAASIKAGRRQRDADLDALGAQKLIRHLNQNAGAIAQQRVVTRGAAMHEILKNLQALRHDVMAFDVFDVGHKADTAGIVFKLRVVETLRFGQSDLLIVF